MKAPRTSKAINIDGTRKLLSAQLIRRLTDLNHILDNNIPPSEEQVDVVERLSKLISMLPPQDNHRIQRIDLLLLIIVVPILLALSFLRLPSTAVDLEVRATGVTLVLGGNHSDLLLPES
jgi:hypothetical protein